jgi:hypothetical protein
LVGDALLALSFVKFDDLVEIVEVTINISTGKGAERWE